MRTFLLFVIFLVLLFSCNKENEEEKISLRMNLSIWHVSSSKAEILGEIGEDSLINVNKRGFYLSKSHIPENPSLSAIQISENGIGFGTYANKFENLSPNTTYFVKAYAVTNKGISLSVEDTFKTLKGKWTKKLNFPGELRAHATSFSIGSKGYVFGGSKNGVLYKDLWEYDPADDTWSLKAEFPGQAREKATSFSIGDKGYVGMGKGENGSLLDFYEYDPQEDKWVRKADYSGLYNIAGVGLTLNYKGYVGPSGTINKNKRNEFFEYNPVENFWTQKANFTGPFPSCDFDYCDRRKYYGFISENRISIIVLNSDNEASCFQYDPSLDIWTDYSSSDFYPGPAYYIHNKSYIFPGLGVYEYDIKNKSLMLYSHIFDISHYTSHNGLDGPSMSTIASFKIGNKVYFCTGSSTNVSGTSTYWKEVWEFELAE